jgi:hypothetical protein
MVTKDKRTSLFWRLVFGRTKKCHLVAAHLVVAVALAGRRGRRVVAEVAAALEKLVEVLKSKR